MPLLSKDLLDKIKKRQIEYIKSYMPEQLNLYIVPQGRDGNCRQSRQELPNLVDAFISNPKENNFKGKKYVLINGASFSASCILSSSLKSDKKIEFVGEETGGDFNGTVAGRMPPFKMPNSKLYFSFGLMDVIPVNQTDKKGRGIFPNQEITTPVQDKVLGKDLEIDWILKQIYP